MKLLISILTSVLIISSFSIPVNTVLANSDSAVIASDHVNMREGPGLAFATIATANEGDTYEILDKEYGWLKVRLSGGKEGWVAEWLTLQNETVQDSAGSQTRKVTADELRVRSGPSTDESILSSLKNGDDVQVASEENGWVEIITKENIKGWVKAEYLSLASAESDLSETDSSANSNMGTISVDRLNVRDDFSSNAAVIGSFNQGDTVIIIDEQYGWLHVEGNGLNGWVSSSYVQTNSTSAQPDQADSITDVTLKDSAVTIMVDALTVRDEPNHAGSSLTTVNLGESYSIEEVSGEWYKISLSSGESGWIASWYTEPGGTVPSADSSSEEGSQLTVLYNGSNVRSMPSVQSEVVARVYSGEQFKAVAQNGEWHEIELSDGTTGFIADWIVSSDEAAAENQTEEDVIEEKSQTEEENVIEEESQEEVPDQPAVSIEEATIVIDAGHGGRDSGAVGAGGSYEKTLTLRTAEILYHKLSSTGATVIMTRQDDRYVDLHTRVASSKLNGADLFISIHYDAIDDRSIKGFTTYYYGDMDQPLAESVHSGLEDQLNLQDRGVQFGNYLVLRENSIPAILLELGYISNPTEEAVINNDQFREIAATGVYNGVVDYFD
ncbi:SH3 domain-containing protein [Jeotgalibacillus campisalis]|uniref:N-acetylmuramoyl-L-alanine amidase n=1 Tax=Jeotgalibacillus campisalis TaxID=220754 RepID=A0A0C2VQ14_9BACL|nr:SH3 domain-containing protein [Jeotgalibacillus campisalis]KIL46103.1 N-acetylmuramoyl-L-alanine amidase [Jeotgalibacillus campisalis]